LRDDPAVGDRIVEDDRIAVVVGLAAGAEAAPEGVDRDRSEERGAALVEDGEVDVDRLHVVVGTDVAVGIGRRGAHGERAARSGEALADAVAGWPSLWARRRQDG